MTGLYLFGLSSRHAEWLSHRQAVVAENVANANTPGYTAKDVAGFGDVLESTRLEMASSSRMHLTGGSGRDVEIAETDETAWDVTHSGNSVSLEQEMLKAGEVSRGFALDTSIAKAFHRMFLTSLKG